MAVFENLDGTGRSIFSIDKNGNKVELRSNAGILEYRNHAGAWTSFGSSDHNSLSGLEGGDPLAVPPEYYHLSAAEHDDLVLGLTATTIHYHDEIHNDQLTDCTVECVNPLEYGGLAEGVYVHVPNKVFAVDDGAGGNIAFKVDESNGFVDISENLRLQSEDGAAFYSTIQAGTIAADTNITLPTSNPSASGKALVSTDTAGTLGWTSVALFIDTTVTPNVIQELTTLGYDNDFVLGSYQLADTTDSAHDKRLFFDQSKAAFRVGSVTGSQWNDSNVGYYSAVVGGTDCTALPNGSGIFCAQTGTILNSNSTNSVIIGGQTGAIGTAGGYYGANSAIVGGVGNNIASGATSSVNFIGGGGSHYIGNSGGTAYASILGGYANSINADYSTIVGGYSHEIADGADYSGIVSGNNHSISAAGLGAVILGGYDNTNAARSAVVMGESGSATHATSLVISAGKQETTIGTCQKITAVVGSTTAGGTSGTSFVDLCLRKTAASRLTVPSNTTFAFEADVVGVINTGTTVGDSIYYKINGLIKNVSGTTSIVGTPVITLIAGDASLTGSGVLVNAAADDTNDALLIQAKSIDAVTTAIYWTASVDMTVVGWT